MSRAGNRRPRSSQRSWEPRTSRGKRFSFGSLVPGLHHIRGNVEAAPTSDEPTNSATAADVRVIRGKPITKGMTAGRDRKNEPSELERARLRDEEKCITCKRRSKTQRCPRCTRQVEANTDRYRGQGRRGPAPKISVDLKDMQYAMEALAKAHAGYHAVSHDKGLSPRQHEERLKEPTAQLHLATKFLVAVRKRNPIT